VLKKLIERFDVPPIERMPKSESVPLRSNYCKIERVTYEDLVVNIQFKICSLLRKFVDSTISMVNYGS
jgi:hypothetical protein